MLQCLQAGQLGGSRLCIGGPRGLPAFRWLLGRRGSGPTPHPSSSAPPSPRPPGPRCSPAATALAVRGRGWGLAFVPALCRALPRWSCVCSAWPRPDPSAGPTGRPWGAEDPVLGRRAGGCPGSVPREKRPRCRRPRRRVVGKERRAGQASSPVLPDGRPEVGRETGSGRPASAQPQPGPQWDQPHIPQMPRVTAWSLFILYLFEQSYVLTIFIDLLT